MPPTSPGRPTSNSPPVGDLLVADYDGGAIKIFGPDAVYKGIFIGGLGNPEGIAQLPGGDLLIGNGGTSAVKRYTTAGAFVEDFVASGAGGLMTPNAVVVRQVPFQINAGIADAWYNPATSGQGFLVTVFPDREEVFLAWFTYDTERPPEDVTANLGEPGHRWLTAQGPYNDDTADLTLYLTAGGVFDAADPAPTTDQDGYGTLTLQFDRLQERLGNLRNPLAQVCPAKSRCSASPKTASRCARRWRRRSGSDGVRSDGVRVKCQSRNSGTITLRTPFRPTLKPLPPEEPTNACTVQADLPGLTGAHTRFRRRGRPPPARPTVPWRSRCSVRAARSRMMGVPRPPTWSGSTALRASWSMPGAAPSCASARPARVSTTWTSSA